MEKLITSSQNKLIKETKSLKNKKDRDKKGLFFVEGKRLTEEAFSSSFEIANVFISQQYSLSWSYTKKSELGKKGIDPYVLPDKLFEEIADTENPQGIIAVLRAQSFKLDDIISKAEKFFVLLDGVRDPGNMGTIIRTADAAGASGIILSPDCVDIYNPKVIRATMGSIFHIPFYISTDLYEDIIRLKNNGIRVYAAHLKGETILYNVSMTGGIAIVIGNEAEGISEKVAVASDELVKIPMPGKSESLNASIAAGLMIYEVVRQRIKT